MAHGCCGNRLAIADARAGTLTVDERLFQHLAELLREQPVVLASVLATRGATPRKRGSRMLITATDTAFSVGGGLAESRVITAARALLQQAADAGDADDVAIDLSGKPGAAGVCGGFMQIGLQRWSGAAEQQRAAAIADALANGESVSLIQSGDRHDAPELLHPNPRLLIVGGGHCAAALCGMAVLLDYQVWVHDSREDCLQSPGFSAAQRLSGSFDALHSAFRTSREVLVVLLNRDFGSDIASLRALADQVPAFIGMMGSGKRIAEVRAAVPELSALCARLQAPVGLDIGAETPHEIAVSILAQLIRWRADRAGA